MISLALHTWRSNLSGYLTVIAATAASGALIAGLFTIIFATESTAPRTDSEGGMDAEFLAAMSSWSVMLGAFATVFVISSTVSFVLDARSRELGLLRLVGAEPRQIKRMVRWEVLACAAVGTGIGCLFAVPVATLVRDGLASAGGIESDLALPWGAGAALATLGISLISAFAGAAGPARRAGRTPPMAALGQASPARRAVGWGRWAMVAITGGGVLAFSLAPWQAWGLDVGAQISLILLISCLLVAAVAGLAPLAVPMAAGVIGTALRAISPGPGLLAQADARFRARRSAALAAPIILAVGSYVALATIVTTINSIGDEDAAEAVVISSSGLDAAELREVCAAQGSVAACTTVAEVTMSVQADDSSWSAPVAIIDPENFQALEPQVISGELANMTGTAIGFDSRTQAGPTALTLPSGESVEVTSAAEIADWIVPHSWSAFYLSIEQAQAWGVAGATDLWLIPEAGTTAEDLARAMRSTGMPGEITTGADLLAERANAQAEQNRRAIFAIVGAAMVLALVSVAVTSLSSARDQREAITLLRRVGGSAGQVLAAAAGDVVLIVTVAGLATLLIPTWAIWQVGKLGIVSSVVVPWGELMAILGASGVLALLATLAGTAWQLRRGLG